MKHKTIKIFVSHKEEDNELVDQFFEIIKIFDANNRLEIVKFEDMEYGDDWREWIYSNVLKSDMLFFIMNNKSSVWDWCIYEAGLFLGSKNSKSSRIIIFCDSNKYEIPEPLNHLQAIQPYKSQIENFLRQFFGATNLTGVELPINPVFAENNSVLSEVSQEISDLFASC